LALEDEQQYAREQVAWQQQQEMRQFPYAQRTNAPQQGGRGNSTFLRNDDVAAQQPPPQQRDTMTDVQEQFSKIAESTSASPPHPVTTGTTSLVVAFGNLSLAFVPRKFAYRNAPPLQSSSPYPFCVAGKRTFNSFVSKVKAKVQEFDQNRYAWVLLF
jgi:hypothetical protein